MTRIGTVLGIVVVFTGPLGADDRGPAEKRGRPTLAGETEPAGATLVDLVLEVVADQIPEGGNFEVQIIARTDSASNQAVFSFRAPITWDPSFLRLVGFTSNGPHPWLFSGFAATNTGAILNEDTDPMDGLPDNDGDAQYQAQDGPDSSGTATPEGLLMGTMLFEALEAGCVSSVAIEETRGITPLVAGPLPGEIVTGAPGSVVLTIDGIPQDDDGDGVNNCLDQCPQTPIEEPANADGCSCSQIGPCDDDGFDCTDELCVAGTCVSTPNNGLCDDGNDCSDDTCDPGDPNAEPSGCVFVNDDTNPCTDGFDCTDDACVDGACVSTPNNGLCDDGNDCSDDACDPGDPNAEPSGCVFVNDDSNPCTDNDDCTEDACVDGTCISTPLDGDGDGVPDCNDNCICTFNPSQCDSDGDGFGNHCDADLNNDGVVGIPDFGPFRACFGSMDGDANFDPACDFNCDGAVGIPDFSIFRSGFGLPPGSDCAAGSSQSVRPLPAGITLKDLKRGLEKRGRTTR